MTTRRLLILGGTSEAVQLQSLVTNIPDLEVITSLAGRTSQPVSPCSRVGGFGGVSGLIEYLQGEKIDFLIDATHPFANQISWNAFEASVAADVPRLQLVRSPWEKLEGDRWIEVDSNEMAAKILPGLAERIFLTIGRQELASYSHLNSLWFLMRMIDPPVPPIPPGQLLLARGPFSLISECSLLQEYQIQAIVSKNSGGSATYAKIIAAREFSLPVIMIQRPPLPEGDRVFDVQAAFDWLIKFY
jgi:precorrin-6A/cobalt-precorrin-6A reductase